MRVPPLLSMLIGMLFAALNSPKLAGVSADEGDGTAIMTSFECGSALPMDFAQVRFNVKRYPESPAFDYSYHDVYLMATNHNCYDCAQSYVLGNYTSLGRGKNCAALLTSYSWTFTLHQRSTGVNYSSISRHLGEYGEYNITAILGGATISDVSYITVEEAKEPHDAYLPVILTIVVCACIALLAFCLPWCRYHFIPRDFEVSLMGVTIMGPEKGRKVAFEDEQTPSKSPLGGDTVTTTPASVVSDTDGGIWKYRQSMDGELNTPLIISNAGDNDVPGAVPSRGVLREGDRGGGKDSPNTPNISAAGGAPSGIINTPSSSPHNTPAAPASGAKKARLVCLDAFRGMSILLMIFVNYGGGGYYFFDHAPWNGLTVADLLFPWFIWIMGTSMAISMKALHTDKSLRELCREELGLQQERSEADVDTKARDAGERMPMLTLDQDPESAEGGINSSIRHQHHHNNKGGYDDDDSYSRRRAKIVSQDWSQWYKIIRRSAILFAIGLFLNGDNDLSSYRIPGVLQYFAIANLAVAGTILLLREATCRELVWFDMEAEKAGLPVADTTRLPPRCSSRQEIVVDRNSGSGSGSRLSEGRDSGMFAAVMLGSPLRTSSSNTTQSARSGASPRSAAAVATGAGVKQEDDRAQDQQQEEGEEGDYGERLVRHFCCPALLNAYDPRRSVLWCYKYEYLIMLCVWLTYVCICLWAKVPGCPRGYNGAGGLGNDGLYSQCTGGIHRYIDVSIFGASHIYQYPTCKQLYGCLSYDPEGLLGSMTAITLTYTGVVTGRILVHFKGHVERLRLWLSIGFMLMFVAACLCGFTQNDGLIPVNKNLWSASFGLLTGGGGMVVLSAFYYVIDVRQLWSGAPLIFLGMNPILLFCAHECFQEYFPFSWYADNPTHGEMLAMNIIGASLWTLMAWYWHQQKFFVKI